MHPILLSLGKFHIYSYGLFVGLGLFLGSYFFIKRAKNYGYDPLKLENFVFYVFLSGIIGARFFYVLINWSNYSQNLLSIFKVWEGGLVFWGGFILAFIVAIYLLKKYKYSFLDIVDIFSPFMILAHAIGRIGCFMAGCCYGKETSCSLGVVFHDEKSLAPLNIQVHPTQLYESIGNFVIFLVLFKLLGVRKFKGQIVAIYLMVYSTFRFCLEFLRGDDRGSVAFLSATQFVCVVAFILGVAIYYYGNKKNNNFSN